MAQINENYLKLQAGYLFPEIGRRVREYKKHHPDAPIIPMGIGDVILPLTPRVIQAFHEGVDEMSRKESFKGYGPEQGYDFLREAIIENDYRSRGVDLHIDEVFISDGSKCDSGNILDIFGPDNKVAVQDPAYPVYVDSSVMGGRTGQAKKNGFYEGICYMPCTAENNFSPELPDEQVDIIFLCYPNNPTGTAARKEELIKWVDYARKNRAVILYDAAYEAYITDPEIPHSIYEVDGAEEVAIEFRSFSKTAGFTGTRCAFTIVPKALQGYTSKGEPYSIHSLWYRRQTTKFNQVSYPVQKAAGAIYTPEGKKETREVIQYYLENARIMRESFEALGFEVYGGINAPYVWIYPGACMSSWELFDKFLDKAHVVGTPGSGFGPSGEGYFRFSAFASRENVLEAMERIKAIRL